MKTSENLELGFGALGDPFFDAWCIFHLLNEFLECREVLHDLHLEHGLELGQMVDNQDVGPSQAAPDEEPTWVLLDHRIEARQVLRCVRLNDGLQKLSLLPLVAVGVVEEGK